MYENFCCVEFRLVWSSAFQLVIWQGKVVHCKEKKTSETFQSVYIYVYILYLEQILLHEGGPAVFKWEKCHRDRERLQTASQAGWGCHGPLEVSWSSHLLLQGCLEPVALDYVMSWHTMERYSMLRHTVLCCKNHRFSFVFSFLQSEGWHKSSVIWPSRGEGERVCSFEQSKYQKQ